MPGTPHLGLRWRRPATSPAPAARASWSPRSIPTGPAAEHGFQTGDVILDVGGKAVANVGDVRTALAQAKSSGKHSVLMRVKNADATRFVAVPLGLISRPSTATPKGGLRAAFFVRAFEIPTGCR